VRMRSVVNNTRFIVFFIIVLQAWWTFFPSVTSIDSSGTPGNGPMFFRCVFLSFPLKDFRFHFIIDLLGSLVEVLVNTTGAPKTEEIEVTAYSPTGRSLRCPLKKVI
jgi:hypothetical protein